MRDVNCFTSQIRMCYYTQFSPLFILTHALVDCLAFPFSVDTFTFTLDQYK
jgi:hypothetical protein